MLEIPNPAHKLKICNERQYSDIAYLKIKQCQNISINNIIYFSFIKDMFIESLKHIALFISTIESLLLSFLLNIQDFAIAHIYHFDIFYLWVFWKSTLLDFE